MWERGGGDGCIGACECAYACACVVRVIVYLYCIVRRVEPEQKGLRRVVVNDRTESEKRKSWGEETGLIGGGSCRNARCKV